MSRPGKKVNVEVLLSKLRKVTTVRLRLPSLSLSTLINYHVWGGVEAVVVGLCEHLKSGSEFPDATLDAVEQLLLLFAARRKARRIEKRQLSVSAEENAAKEDAFRALFTSKAMRLCEGMGASFRRASAKRAALLTDKQVCYPLLMFLAGQAVGISAVSIPINRSDGKMLKGNPKRQKSPTTSSSSRTVRTQGEDALQKAIFSPSPPPVQSSPSSSFSFSFSVPPTKCAFDSPAAPSRRQGRPAWVDETSPARADSGEERDSFYYVDDDRADPSSPCKLASEAASTASPSTSRARMPSLDTLIMQARKSVNESTHLMGASASEEDEDSRDEFRDEFRDKEGGEEGVEHHDHDDPIHQYSRMQLVKLVQAQRVEARRLSRQLALAKSDCQDLLREKQRKSDGDESFSRLKQSAAPRDFDDRQMLLMKAQQLQMERQLRLVDSGMSLRRGVLHDCQQWMGSVKSALMQHNAGGDYKAHAGLAERATPIVESVDWCLAKLDEAERVSLLDRVGLLEYAQDDRTRLMDVYGKKNAADHVDLDKVHRLNAMLRLVQKDLSAAHSVLVKSGVAAHLTTSLFDRTLHAERSESKSRHAAAVPAALKSMRGLMYELDALAVLLPHSTKDFASQIESDMSRRGVLRALGELRTSGRVSFTAKDLKGLLAHAREDARCNALQISRLESETQSYKRSHEVCVDATTELLEHCSGVYNTFQINRNAAYRRVCEVVAAAVDGWQDADDAKRMDAYIRLITTVQSVCPDLENMLTTKRVVESASPGQGAGRLVLSLKRGLDEAYGKFEEQLRMLGTE